MHVPATCHLYACCLPCVLPVPRVPSSLVFAGGMKPPLERRCPCGLCPFQWVMSCPGGGEAPQKLLPPGPGTQAWPGAPSQMEAGRYCISPGGEVEAQPGLATGMEELCGPHPQPGSLLLPGPSCAVLTATSTPLLRASQWRPQWGQPLASAWRNVGVLVRGCGCRAPA